jgi:hypothetical protein
MFFATIHDCCAAWTGFPRRRHSPAPERVIHGLAFHVLVRSSMNAAPPNDTRTALLRGLKVQNGLPWPDFSPQRF